MLSATQFDCADVDSRPMRRWYACFAVALIAGALAAPALGQVGPNPAGFVRGHIFFSVINACSVDGIDTRLMELDPETGALWTWHTHQTGLQCPRGLRFTPDGQFLRILDSGVGAIYDMDATGTLFLRYDFTNGGPIAPLGANGLCWDRSGNFYVTDGFSSRVFTYLSDQLPPIIGPQVGAGGMSYIRSGRLFVASGSLKELISPTQRQVLDQYTPAVATMSSAADFEDNLFTAVIGNGFRIYRYPHASLADRTTLAELTGVNGSWMVMDMNSERNLLYVAIANVIFAVDSTNGLTSILATLPVEEYYLGHGLAVYAPPPAGDMNCDGVVDNFDVDPFVLAIVNPGRYLDVYHFCNIDLADINGDGAVNNFDIDPFIAQVLGQ